MYKVIRCSYNSSNVWKPSQSHSLCEPSMLLHFFACSFIPLSYHGCAVTHKRKVWTTKTWRGLRQQSDFQISTPCETYSHRLTLSVFVFLQVNTIADFPCCIRHFFIAVIGTPCSFLFLHTSILSSITWGVGGAYYIRLLSASLLISSENPLSIFGISKPFPIRCSCFVSMRY